MANLINNKKTTKNVISTLDINERYIISPCLSSKCNGIKKFIKTVTDIEQLLQNKEYNRRINIKF